MIAKILLFALVGAVICRDVMDNEVTIAFGSFMREFNKNYESIEETVTRYNIFAENYRYIQNHNEFNYDFTLGVNQFADLTMEEIKEKYLGLKAPDHNPCKLKHEPIKGEPKIDWRAKGAVAKVKNQGNCGSCWAFSAIGALEGLHFILTKELTTYSEQELVDCSRAYWNEGCNGGEMNQAFEYIKDQGISTDKEYPYEGRDRSCRKKSKSFVIDGCVNVTKDDNDNLLEALAHGPVSVAVKANNREFMYYRGGIIKSGCGKQNDELDHGITLVGADEEKGTPFWIVKNSWGPSWGEKGYVRIKRDTGKGHSMCGIAMDACYPVKK
jgi:xylem cysteine proteinase